MEATSNKKETLTEIINGDKPVLIDFSAEWCGPCKMMKPVLQELYQRMGGELRILKIDVDQSPAIAMTWQIQSVPTLILFRNGKAIWRESGVLQTPRLEKIIKEHTTKS